MLKKILITIVVVLALFSIFVATRPADYRVTRSLAMNAPAGEVFVQVNELKKWEAWSPWQKLDPNMKQTYDGPAAGKGAVSAWAGNSKVGEGRMTITESKPNEKVGFLLEFLKPMAAMSTSEFDFKQTGNQTTVTWTMDGKNNFIGKAMCVFMNMDKMVGGDFEKGLSQLKTVVETKK